MKRWVKATVAVAAVLILTVMAEIFLGNFHALSQKHFRISAEITDDRAELVFDHERHIKTLTVEYICDTDVSITISLYDGAGQLLRTWDTIIDARLDKRVFSLQTSAGRVEVIIRPEAELLSEDPAAPGTAEQSGAEEILRVTAANFFEWNPIRLLFFAVLFGLAAVFLFLRSGIWEKPEYIFAIIAFASGLLLIVMTGSNQISYDEQTHVAQAWNLSYLGTVYDTEAVLECKTLTVPYFHNIWERREVEAHLNSIHDLTTANIFSQTKMISYEKRAYLPIAFGFALGRLLHLPFVWILALGKVCNLLMYILVCAVAIRLAQKGKMLVAVIALLPNSIFSASQFSYDACVNCFLILAMVLIMNELLNPRRRVKPLTMLAILGCFMIGSYAKQIYILMALIMLFFGHDKFSSRSREVLFKLVLTVFCLTMVYEVLAPSYSGASASVTLAGAGDSRVEGTGTLRQIQWILGQPFSYLKLLLTSQFGRIVQWLNGQDQFLMYAYLGTPGLLCTWLWLAAWLFAGVVSPAEEGRKSIGRKFVLLNLLMSFCMAAVVWTVLYLSFNVVGSAVIEGVQNRYFTPIFLPVGMCLMNGKFHFKWGGQVYQKLLFALCAALLFYCNWKLGICAYYL